MLSWQICSRARLSRDARFDGKFFIAVLTTRIYCRSICPARTCKESNVRYFPTAVAASEAGFRPCLRCRPERSPGTPAWLGTPTTVSRALRLISESGLDEAGIEGLADRVGVGSRHLRRLFIQHLGATPSAVAQTRRLQFAKKLIDETTLPMVQVADAAGFGCVRRFNATIRKVYHRTPTQIRRLARQTVQPEDQYVFRLPYRPPYDWQSMLTFLAEKATPGVEVVRDGIYRRCISIQNSSGYFEVSLDRGKDSLLVRVQIPDPRSLFFITERVRAMFDLNADFDDIVKNLRGEPTLQRAAEATPGLRVPGGWDPFELTICAILGQSVSAAGATSLIGRIVRALGQPFIGAPGLTHLFPTAEALADADLASLAVPARKAATIRALARAICDRQIHFEGILDLDDFLRRLTSVDGIEKSAAQYVAMRALNEPDAFPSGDRGLQRGLGVRDSRELERRANAWRPWRAYAAMYLTRVEREKRCPVGLLRRAPSYPY